MENHLKWLKIRNFKSIKSVDFDCKRINVFVGRPNVGKSNILEAISMLGWPFPYSDKFGEGMIRYNTIPNLFYDQDLKREAAVETEEMRSILVGDTKKLRHSFLIGKVDWVDKLKVTIAGQLENDTMWAGFSNRSSLNYAARLDNQGSNSFPFLQENTTIKLYKFLPFSNNENRKLEILDYPSGKNLFQILFGNKELAQEVGGLFANYGLGLVLDPIEETMEVQKLIDQISYKTAYNLIADTLQRIIFYLAAIRSNENSVLIFEEPENHSYPQYVNMLAHEIIDSESNQFFLTTHNPYLLNTLMTKGGFDDVAVFITDYENYQTTVHQLSEPNWRELLDYGIDIFFNPDWFKVNV